MLQVRGACEGAGVQRAVRHQPANDPNITAYARLAGVRYGVMRRWPCVPAQNMAVSVGLSVLCRRPEDDGCRPPVEPVTAASATVRQPESPDPVPQLRNRWRGRP